MKYYFKGKMYSEWKEVSLDFIQKVIDDRYDDCCVVELVKTEKNALYFCYEEFEC